VRYFTCVRQRTLLLLTIGAAAVASVVAVAAEPAGEKGAAPPVADGAALYDRYCLACHGAAGDGNGPAAPWLHPKPRDLTRGRYKWRSTGGGKIPTDADLARVIRDGAPGTSMPPFTGILDAAQVDALVAQVKSFAPKRFAPGGKPPAVIAAPPVPQDLATRESDGKELFGKLGCAQCHGAGGKGDGPTAPDLKDAAGRPAPPFDFTSRPLRRGGGPAEIYLTLVTGLDGTPMAAFDSRPASKL